MGSLQAGIAEGGSSGGDRCANQDVVTAAVIANGQHHLEALALCVDHDGECALITVAEANRYCTRAVALHRIRSATRATGDGATGVIGERSNREIAGAVKIEDTDEDFRIGVWIGPPLAQ